MSAPPAILRTAILLALPLIARGASPRADAVRQVASLRAARSVHTATTLRDGQVLIVGGMVDGGGSVASVELYDPARDAVRELAPLAHRRAGHTATLLPDGRVLVAGGYDGGYLASLEIYDPATRRFGAAGAMLEGRSAHTATLLPDGRVLLAGGVGRGWSFLRSAEVYDAATGRSTAVGDMAVAREGHTATLLGDGRVLVVGGHAERRPSVTLHASAEVYAPRTRRFEAAGALAIARHKHDAVLIADGRVLVIGGADVTDRVHFATTELWEPARGAFAPGPRMAHARYKLAGTSVRLPGGDVLVTGGASVVERLDVARLDFRAVPGRLPAAFRFAAAAPLRDGALVTGGYSDANRGTAGVWRVVAR